MREMPFKVILPDGFVVEGWSAYSVCEQLRRHDWGFPVSVLDFKQGLARRCEVAGMLLLFWDANSFLLAASQAKVFRLWIDGVEL